MDLVKSWPQFLLHDYARLDDLKIRIVGQTFDRFEKKQKTRNIFGNFYDLEPFSEVRRRGRKRSASFSYFLHFFHFSGWNLKVIKILDDLKKAHLFGRTGFCIFFDSD